MNTSAKNQLGQGVPDLLPLFKPTGKPSPLSAEDLNRVVRAVWPLQNVKGVAGIEVTRGDKNLLIGLDKETMGNIQNAIDAAVSTSLSAMPFRVTYNADAGTFTCTAGKVEVRRLMADTQPFIDPLGQTYILTQQDNVQKVQTVAAASGSVTSTQSIFLKITHDVLVNNGEPTVEIVADDKNPGTFYFDKTSDIYTEEWFPIWDSTLGQIAFNNITGQYVPRHRGEYSPFKFYYPGDLVSMYSSSPSLRRTYRQVADTVTGLADSAIWNLDPTSSAGAFNWVRVYAP